MATHRRSADGHPIRIRTRAPFHLQNFFNGNQPLAAEGARFDRMEVKRDYLISNVPFDYDSPIELANHIAAGHAVVGEALDARCGAFVRKLNGSDASMKVALHRTTAEGARWLVDLTLRFRFAGGRPIQTGEAAARPRTQMQVTLVMSPTRLAAHARMRGIDMAAANWQNILTSDEDTFQAIADESASMRHDNLMPGHLLHPVAQSEVATDVRSQDATAGAIIGLRAVEELIEHLVGCRVADRRWLAPQRPWVITQVETYWEFGQVNAIEAVRRLRPTLWTLCKDSGERIWSLDDGMELLAFTGRLTDAVGIAIYPKTVDRIRLEIRHRKDIPGNAEMHIAERLRLIALNAVGRADHARRAIVDAHEQRGGEEWAPDALIGRLSELAMLLQNQYSGRPQLAADVLEQLLTLGGVWCQGDEALVSVSDAQVLKQRGVVEAARIGRQSTRDPYFPLAARYRPLFQMFSPVGQE